MKTLDDILDKYFEKSFDCATLTREAIKKAFAELLYERRTEVNSLCELSKEEQELIKSYIDTYLLEENKQQ